jgi:hypothetical protein
VIKTAEQEHQIKLAIRDVVARNPLISVVQLQSSLKERGFKTANGKPWVFSAIISLLIVGVVLYGMWSLGKFGAESCDGNETGPAAVYCNIFSMLPKKDGGGVTVNTAPSATPRPPPRLPVNANFQREDLPPGVKKTVCVTMAIKVMNCRLTDGGFPDAVEIPSEFNGHFNAHLVEPSGIRLDEQWVYYKSPDGTIYGPEFPAPSPELTEIVPVTNWIRLQGSGIVQFTAK